MDVTRVVPRAGFVMAVAMLLALATASAAGAQSVVSHDNANATIRYIDPAASVDRIAVAVENDGSDNWYSFTTTTPGVAPSPGTNCETDAGAVICPADSTDALAAQLGGGDDSLDLTGGDLTGIFALTSTVQGGSGDDALRGGVLTDDFGGGSGDDTLVGLTSGDEFRGQDGTDTLDLRGAPGSTITLNDIPDDGPGTGGSADVGSDVEVVLGGTGSDDFTGGVAAERLDGGGGDDVLEGGAGSDQLQGGTGADTILARDRFVDSVGCGDGADVVFADWNDTVAPGCETVNRSLRDDDGDGSPTGVDCDDANPDVKPGGGDIPGNGLDEDCAGGDAVVDADGDGVGAAVDCDDKNAARFPGATEVPENGVDENCDGRDGEFPTVAATVASGWKVFARYTKLTALKVKGAPAGAKVRVSCKGGKRKGCPFKQRTSTANAKGKASLAKRFKGRKLRPGVVIEVRISVPSAVAKVLRIRIRDEKAPKRTTLCLPPGAKKPGSCG